MSVPPSTARVCAAALALLSALAFAPTIARAQKPAQTTQRGSPALSLSQVFEALKARNESWAVTRERIRQSRAERRLARARLLPSLSVRLSGARANKEITLGDRVIRPQYSWGGNLAGELALVDLTQYPAYRAAGVRVRQTIAEAVWQRRLLREEAERAYITLAAAQRDEAIVAQEIALRARDAARVRALVKAQLATPLDVARAQQQVLTAKQAALDARRAREDAADSLAILLGRPAGSALTATADLATLARRAPTAIGSLARRPDLIASEREILASAMEEDALWYAFFPTLSLGLNGQLGPSTLSNPDGYNWSLSLTLSWVLYDGGARAARLDARRAQTQTLRLEQRVQQRQAHAALVQAQREYRTAQEAVRVARAQIKVSEEALQLAQRRMDRGLTTTVEVHDAMRARFLARRQLNQAHLRAALAAARARTLQEVLHAP